MGFLVPLPDPQVGKSFAYPRTFLTVQEFIWYNCSALCGSFSLWLNGGVNGDLLQQSLCHTQVCHTQSPCPCDRSLLTGTSVGDTKTFKGRSGSVSVGSPGVHKVLFEPSERLWWVWSLILNAILPLLPSCLGFSFALGCGVYFFGGIQHYPTDRCSAASCNFGVLTGEDEHMFFYSTISTKDKNLYLKMWLKCFFLAKLELSLFICTLSLLAIAFHHSVHLDVVMTVSHHSFSLKKMWDILHE